MNDKLISKIYDYKKEMTSLTGFFVCTINEPIVEIPNNTLTRKKFDIP